MHEAENIIAQLGLQPLPGEGGYYRRTWTGPLQEGRPAGTAIYFLITRKAFSALHRLTADEIWHFYAGDPVELVRLDPAGFQPAISTLGPEFSAGQVPQQVVPGGTWQGARLVEDGTQGWALLGCTMTPGWDDRDFTLGERARLLTDFPAAAEWIDRLTR
jgi:uncharacterized protein